MRIAIDARLNAYRQGGIPQYTRQLMTALAGVAPDDQFISMQHRDQIRPLVIAPNVVRRTVLTPPHHRFEQWSLPLEVLLARPDVLHCPDFIAPLRRSCAAVVTIHDLAFMHYPEILDTAAKAYYGQVAVNVPRADAVIAVSESTRQDIAQFLDIPIEQIDVVYEAAAPLYTRLELRAGEARVLNATPVSAGTFMLFVSTLEPRKNLPTLLQALRICLDRQPNAGYKLVIVGRRGWRDDAIFQTVRDLRLADHILFAGGVGQYDLRWLYNACRFYVNPSLYEGFGLPLLEAMACGAPCLAAATSSLPEVGGDAAIYVPPLDAAQWADEMMALWDDIERRDELGRLGMARAQHFSWQRAARETWQVYQRVADRTQPRATVGALSAVPAPMSKPVAPSLDDPRLCLRCATTLVHADLQTSMRIRTDSMLSQGDQLTTQVWVCPRCGFTELVAEAVDSASFENTQPAAETVPSQLEDVPDPLLAPPYEPDLSLLDVADAAGAHLYTLPTQAAETDLSGAATSKASESLVSAIEDGLVIGADVDADSASDALDLEGAVLAVQPIVPHSDGESSQHVLEAPEVSVSVQAQYADSRVVEDAELSETTPQLDGISAPETEPRPVPPTNRDGATPSTPPRAVRRANPATSKPTGTSQPAKRRQSRSKRKQDP